MLSSQQQIGPSEPPDHQIDLVGATVSDPESKLPPRDGVYKFLITIVTLLVLFYPIISMRLYPFPSSIPNLENNLLKGGSIILGLNFVFALSVLFYLQRVHESLTRAIGDISADAVKGGASAREAIHKTLAIFAHLLSWRYFFAYIGIPSVGLYALLSILGLVNLEFLQRILQPFLPDFLAPATHFFGDLAIYVLAYYAIAFLIRSGLRFGLRPLIGPLMLDR
jgi:hypothetical protein